MNRLLAFIRLRLAQIELSDAEVSGNITRSSAAAIVERRIRLELTKGVAA